MIAPVPEGLSVSETSDALLIEQRATHAKRARAKILLIAVSVGLSLAWAIELLFLRWVVVAVALALLTAVCAVWLVPIAGWLFHRTVIRVGVDAIDTDYLRFGPFYDTRLLRELVVQLYATRTDKPRRALGDYQVRAVLDLPHSWLVVQGLETAEQARFVERAIEERLGIADRSVLGELERSASEASEPLVPGELGNGDTSPSLGMTLAYSAIYLIALGLATAGLVIVTLPRGDSIGTIDLLTQSTELIVEARTHDLITFTADVEVDERSHPGMTLKGLKHMASDATLNVTLRDAAGLDRPANCSLYAGFARHARGKLSGASLEGMSNACRFTVEAPGRHVIRVGVAWPRGAPRRASLEVWRERK